LPGYFSFPDTEVGQESHCTFTLTNVGTGTANGHIYLSDITNYHIEGSQTQFSLDANEPWEFVVSFAPQSQGEHDCVLTADGSNCDDVSFKLVGIGLVGGDMQ
jgi:hypothetical protein